MERRSSLLAICVALLLLAPILYVLSIGPAAWLGARGYIRTDGDAPASRVYLPLAMIANKSELCGDVLVGYMQLWASVESEELHAY